MKRTVFATLVAACAMTLASMPMTAQEAQSTQGGQSDTEKAALDADVQLMRQDLRSQRKQITAANVNLTADESTKFWPIYDQYIQETIKINDTRWALIKEYAANYNSMTDQLAEDYMKRSTAIQQQLVALREKYVPTFEKVVSPKKTAQWYQIDRRIDLLIDLQLASMIPVVDASK
jgi:Spy/CpxP family protein refolding chaperone